LTDVELQVLESGLASVPSVRRRAVAEIRRLRGLVARVRKARVVGYAIDAAATNSHVEHLEALDADIQAEAIR
jgi:hypothetical protein